MPEKIPTDPNHIAARFTAVAVVKAGSPKELRGKLMFDVSFTVNGIQLPFVATMEQFAAELEADVDRRAIDLAQDLVSEVGLSRAVQAIRLANLTVAAALTEAHQRLRDKTDETYVQRT